VLKKVGTSNSIVYNAPIIFSSLLEHYSVAEHFGGKDNVASAGFVKTSIDKHGVVEFTTYGKSVSLDIPSIPSDKALVSRVFK
tara:strand:- start:129 stop:377 length:249 start_codon:yes stop_codon:yes gene_type:complete